MRWPLHADTMAYMWGRICSSRLVPSLSCPAVAPKCAPPLTALSCAACLGAGFGARAEVHWFPCVQVEWFEKTFAPYGSNASDTAYYLGLGRLTSCPVTISSPRPRWPAFSSPLIALLQIGTARACSLCATLTDTVCREAVANASSDVLGAALLAAGLSWSAVERAVPPIRSSGPGGEWGTDCRGVRTFVGSRGAAYDGAIDDQGRVSLPATPVLPPPFFGGEFATCMLSVAGM